jgi:glycosyltransferase involved in cell wall biosynthesis
MRVALGAIVRTLGGPATYARELVAALVARAPRTQEYVVLTDGPEAFEGLDVEVRHVALASPYAQVVWDHGMIPVALRRSGVDLYHGTKNTLPALLPCPAVVTVHDLAVYHHPASFAALQRWHLRTHTPLAVRAARAIITVSRHAAADLCARFPRAAVKVHAVPNGVSARFHPVADEATRTAFRARHGLGGGPLVGYLGTLQPRKNVELLAAAFARIASAVPGAELVLAGRIRPGYRPALPHAGVRLIGPLPARDLATFYSSAAVLVSPSLYEGFGLTLLEAMACGCPVIALNRSAVPEVVGDAALLLDEADEQALAAALMRVLGDPAAAAELRRRGLARAAHFSWTATAAATAAIYDQVARHRAATAIREAVGVRERSRRTDGASD